MHYSYLMQEPSEFVSPRFIQNILFENFLSRTRSRPRSGIPEITIDWGYSVKWFFEDRELYFLLIQKYFEFGGVKF